MAVTHAVICCVLLGRAVDDARGRDSRALTVSRVQRLYKEYYVKKYEAAMVRHGMPDSVALRRQWIDATPWSTLTEVVFGCNSDKLQTQMLTLEQVELLILNIIICCILHLLHFY